MNTGDFFEFLNDHLKRVEPLFKDSNTAYWNASISGKKKDFKRYTDLQNKLHQIHSDREAFEKILQWKKDQTITNPLTRRQIEILYNDFHRHQIDRKLNEKITALASKIENQFNISRAKLNGRTVTNNELIQILKTSEDSEFRKKAWEAAKEVGTLVRNDLITLVKLRNEAARSLGYKNFYGMAMDLSEQDEDYILSLFKELDSLTAEPYESMKAEVDDLLASRYKISPQEIRPWHYEDPFFQEAPNVYKVDLDKYFERYNILDLVAKFYKDIGLDVDDILIRSDLFEKPGKVQHAFCTDIDRKGDIRILANVKNNETWAGTMLHELGHAIYMKHIDPSLPYLLREEAHIFTTEAVSMLFGRFSKNPTWLQAMMGLPDSEIRAIEGDLDKNQRFSQLIFARWCQVMLHFERELYNDPEQDLNKLWWDLAQRYQKLRPPEERDGVHWASKIHIVSAPVYYHNYMLGEILASQLDFYIRKHVIPPSDGKTPIFKQAELGKYLIEIIFRLGARYKWDRLIEIATGEKLSPRYFVDQFVR